MAVAFGAIYSQKVKAIGVIAGGPYLCANGAAQVWRCTSGRHIATAKQWARKVRHHSKAKHWPRLITIHGMRDRVVLFKDTVTLVQRLIDLGKDVDLVTLPNSGHGWDNEGLAQTRFAFNKMVEFFNRHLGGGNR